MAHEITVTDGAVFHKQAAWHGIRLPVSHNKFFKIPEAVFFTPHQVEGCFHRAVVFGIQGCYMSINSVQRLSYTVNNLNNPKVP